jgi:hypothetical protein
MPGASKTVIIPSAIAFALVGAVTIALIAVGYQELQPSNQYLGIDGMAEVLLIIGIYFLIPYLFVLVCAIAVYSRVGSTLTDAESTALWLRSMKAVLLLAYLMQQVFTNMYLVEWRGIEFIFVFIIFDVAIPFVYSNSVFHYSSVPAYLYTTVYVVKLALMWDVVPLMQASDSRWAYGPNGMRVMLFLCIPIIQLPVYISLVERGHNVMQAFTRQMNAVLGHLLHSLDTFAIFELAFTGASGAPSTVLGLCCVLMTLAFLANNICFVSLFHRSQKFEELSRTVVAHTGDDGMGSGASIPYRKMEDTLATERQGLEMRVLAFLLLLTLFVDLPFFIARFVMWYLDNVQISLFIVKDAKNMIEVAMLVSRNAAFTMTLRDRFRWWE